MTPEQYAKLLESIARAISKERLRVKLLDAGFFAHLIEPMLKPAVDLEWDWHQASAREALTNAGIIDPRL